MRELQPTLDYPQLQNLEQPSTTPNWELNASLPVNQITLGQRFANSRVGKAVVGSFAAIGIMAGSTTPTAIAESDHVYTITGTAGEGVWLHGDPGLGDQGDLIKIMPEGSRFTADCYVNDTPLIGKPRGLLFILPLAVAWFLILPLPFDKASDITQQQWHWLGGYHAVVEPFTHSSPSETVAYMNKYHYSNSWQPLWLFLVSSLLAILTYRLASKLK